jgi:uncharacterized membrane protein
MRHVLWTTAILAMVGLVGCNQSEQGGRVNDQTRTTETFRLRAPMTSTTIKQGDRQTVKLTLDRGKNFKEEVTLRADPPSGISVDLDPQKVKPSDTETVTATVSVSKNAAVGDHTIRVTAKPETGNAATVDFKVQVEKKSD